MKRHDNKALRQKLKPLLDRETTARLLNYLGYGVTSMFKFKVREERTPSASIGRDGSIKDFGTGEHFSDVIALLHEKQGLSLTEATRWTAECLGVNHG